MKKIYIDLETNKSLNPKTGTITQLAGIITSRGKVIKRFDFKRNIYKNLIEVLDKHCDKYNKTDKFYFIAYNAEFDTSFVRQLFAKNNNKYFGSYFHTPSICVMQKAAAKLMGKTRKPENFKLETVAKYFKIPTRSSRFHDAAYDIDITYKIDRLL